MAEIVARLDDLPAIFGDLLCGGDIDGRDEEFAYLNALEGEELCGFLIERYIRPQILAKPNDEIGFIKTILSYFLKNPVAEQEFEGVFNDCILPFDVPKPYHEFLHRVFTALFLGETVEGQPEPDKVLI